MSRYDWGQQHPGIDRLAEQITETRNAVITHPMYAALDSRPAILTFMEHHVSAVWDFMSLTINLALEGRARLWDGILAAIGDRVAA